MKTASNSADFIQLEWMDEDWSAQEFEKFLETPDSIIMYCEEGFVCGIQAGQSILIERIKECDEVWEWLGRFPVYSPILTLGVDDNRVAFWHDSGFVPECVGCMKIRMRKNANDMGSTS